MATIKMTPEEVRMLSKVYDASSDEVNRMLSTLTRTQRQLEQTWEGEAFRAFDQQFENMKPTVQRFSQLLGDVYNQLQKIAYIMETTDKEISKTVSSEYEKF